jgi:N-acetylmuramoyl-L-alanine amidase
MRFIILLFLFFMFSSFQTDTQPEYLRVKLYKDMSVQQLLESYFLNEYDCNYQQFLKINKLTKDIPLRKSKIYNLPILIYQYNGKSIRSSLGIADLDLAKFIESFNTNLFKKNMKQQSYKVDNYLYVPNHALNCRNKKVVKPKVELNNTEIPEKLIAGRTQTVGIFGKKYEEVPIIDKKLKGKIFYVEGGHGGPDPGAQAKVEGRTLCEDEYAYDVSLRVARELIKHSATVFIINRDPNDGIRDGDFLLCDSDEQTFPDLKVPARQKPRLFQRSDAVNQLFEKYNKKGITDQRLIVIHVDSRGKKEHIDTFLYYQSGNEESYRIAKKMQATLESKYATKANRDYTGTVTTRDLHMLRETKPTTVFVEIGNIRNEFDRKRIMIKNNRQAIASWLAEGFMK